MGPYKGKEEGPQGNGAIGPPGAPYIEQGWAEQDPHAQSGVCLNRVGASPSYGGPRGL